MATTAAYGASGRSLFGKAQGALQVAQEVFDAALAKASLELVQMVRRYRSVVAREYGMARIGSALYKSYARSMSPA